MGIGWNFPSNNFSQLTGISEAGIETFRGAPYSSLAREICQNSLDAILEGSKPVTVEFQKIYVNKLDIPGYEQLKDALQRCLDCWKIFNNEKAVGFLQNSCKVIDQDELCVLRISDFNTEGLTGSDKEFDITPWQSLLKASGVSDKSGAAGGSYGIGKSAPFVCSDIRTLFYSTYDINGLTAVQGVSRLVSFKDENDKVTQGIGYYGNIERNTPISVSLSLDKNFNRSKRTGTDIYILGFMEDDKWKEQMIVSILEGFLVSINDNKLIVKIDDVTISKGSLSTIINDYKNGFKYAYNYYQVLTSEESIVVNKDFENLGEIELRVLFSPDLHRKALITRSTGMKIFDKQNISGTIQFAAVLNLKSQEVNQFFRQMESPQHDAWEPNRHPDTKNAKKKRLAIFKFIKDTIHDLGQNKNTDEMDAEGVGEFLPDDISVIGRNGEKEVEETVTDKTKNIDIKVIDKVLVSQGFAKNNDDFAQEEVAATGEVIEDEDSEAIGRFPTGKSNILKGGLENIVSTKENDDSENIIKKYTEVGTTYIRMFLIDKSAKLYKLIFLPEKSATNGYVKISLSGEQSNTESDVKSAYLASNTKLLKCKKGKIYLDRILENEKTSLFFILSHSDNYSMEVGLYGNQI
ncbi:MAG: hypothetical protein WCR27_05635 [Eubacteriales bacterium]